MQSAAKEEIRSWARRVEEESSFSSLDQDQECREKNRYENDKQTDLCRQVVVLPTLDLASSLHRLRLRGK
ncbi:hypothetical protein EJB05_12704, partial [Eragrostis curvula]